MSFIKATTKAARGQAGVEYVVLTAIGIVIFMVVLIVINDQFSIITSQRTMDEARLSLKKIADAAAEVYQQGSGARKVITVTFPAAVDAGSPQIVNDTIMLTIKGSRVSYKVDFPISGTLPPSGTFTLELTSRGGTVVAGALPFTVSPPVIHYDVCAASFIQTRSETLVFANNQNMSTPVDVAAIWTNGSVNLSFSPSSFVLPFQGSQNVSVDIRIAPNTVGFFDGYLAANTTTGANYAVAIPVTANIVACPVNVTGVARITVTTWKDSNYNVTKTAFGPVENVTISGTMWLYSAPLTIDIRYPDGTSVAGYPQTTVTNSTGGFVHVFNPSGLPSGNYTARANQSATVKTTTFVLRGCS